jgi:hypothetical protein
MAPITIKFRLSLDNEASPIDQSSMTRAGKKRVRDSDAPHDVNSEWAMSPSKPSKSLRTAGWGEDESRPSLHQESPGSEEQKTKCQSSGRILRLWFGANKTADLEKPGYGAIGIAEKRAFKRKQPDEAATNEEEHSPMTDSVCKQSMGLAART